MDADVTSVTVLDRHSGTTGRAHLALTGHPSVPPTVFVKLAPFDVAQRKFVNRAGHGRRRGPLLPRPRARAPGARPAGVVRRVRRHRHRRRRPLRDGARRPRRVGLPLPDPRRRRHRGAHLRHRRATSPASTRSTGRARASGPAATSRGSRPGAPASGDGGAGMVQHGDRQPHRPPARRLRRRRRDLRRARAGDHAALPRGRVHARARRSAPRQPVRRRRRPATAPASSTGR